MRCSLLALSSYLDSELDIEPSGELEAHLVACERCRTAMGYLREESSRIGALARVHIPDDAVHELFSQIGLIAEEDDLPEGPVRRDRPATVEAPPWFGAERGAALPWAPRPSRHGETHGAQPRELVGERMPTTSIVEPPELLLWDDPIDEIATSVPEPPPMVVVPLPLADFEQTAQNDAVPAVHDPVPPSVAPVEPLPPDLSTSADVATAPRLAPGPNPFQRFRDRVAVRLALWRGSGSRFDSGVEIVSGAGAPTWNQRARPKPWGHSPPVVAVEAPSTVDSAAAPAAAPKRRRLFNAPAAGPPHADDSRAAEPIALTAEAPEEEATQEAAAEAPVIAASATTAPPELAELLSEVASLAALDREQVIAKPEEPAVVEPVERTPVADLHAWRAVATPLPVEEITLPRPAVTPFDDDVQPASPPVPGRHVRRLRTQKTERREWNPTHPVTGRHVLPIGGPAVGAADRDRRLWVFGAVTVAVMLLGLLIGKQVTQPKSSALGSTAPQTTPRAHAVTPPTAVPVPVITPTPAPTVAIPVAPMPQQLTGATTLGTGSTGFSVGDVRYGMHPHDFRLVFDLAFPNSVSGNPTTVIGYYGATTLYVEFTGVIGASNIAGMPPGQVVASVEALPMARNTDRLIFKITLRKNAPFDAYYLSGARLVIDVT